MATPSPMNRGYSSGLAANRRPTTGLAANRPPMMGLAAGSQPGGGFRSNLAPQNFGGAPTPAAAPMSRPAAPAPAPMMPQMPAMPEMPEAPTAPDFSNMFPPQPLPQPGQQSFNQPPPSPFAPQPLPQPGQQSFSQPPPSPFAPQPLPFGGFRQEGGPVQPGRAYIVGEKGPEMIVPKDSGTVIPNHRLFPDKPIKTPAMDKLADQGKMDTLPRDQRTISAAVSDSRASRLPADPEAAQRWLKQWEDKEADKAEAGRDPKLVAEEKRLGLPSIKHLHHGVPESQWDETKVGFDEGLTRIGQTVAGLGDMVGVPGSGTRRDLYGERADVMQSYRERQPRGDGGISGGDILATGISEAPGFFNPLNKPGKLTQVGNAIWHGIRGYAPEQSLADAAVALSSNMVGEKVEDFVSRGKGLVGNVVGTVFEKGANHLRAVNPSQRPTTSQRQPTQPAQPMTPKKLATRPISNAGLGITPRAEGGPVIAGKPYLVGEKGPEIIVPQQPGMVVPNDALRSGSLASRPAVPVGRGMTPERRLEIAQRRAITRGDDRTVNDIARFQSFQGIQQGWQQGRQRAPMMGMPPPMPARAPGARMMPGAEEMMMPAEAMPMPPAQPVDMSNMLPPMPFNPGGPLPPSTLMGGAGVPPPPMFQAQQVGSSEVLTQNTPEGVRFLGQRAAPTPPAATPAPLSAAEFGQARAAGFEPVQVDGSYFDAQGVPYLQRLPQPTEKVTVSDGDVTRTFTQPRGQTPAADPAPAGPAPVMRTTASGVKVKTTTQTGQMPNEAYPNPLTPEQSLEAARQEYLRTGDDTALIQHFQQFPSATKQLYDKEGEAWTEVGQQITAAQQGQIVRGQAVNDRNRFIDRDTWGNPIVQGASSDRYARNNPGRMQIIDGPLPPLDPSLIEYANDLNRLAQFRREMDKRNSGIR